MVTTKLNLNPKETKYKNKIYIHIGTDTLTDYIKPITNEKWSEKPRGGFWASPYTPNSKDGFKSDWERYLAHEGYDIDRPKTYILFELDNANILQLRNKKDIDFCRENGFILSEDYQVTLDFELIASSGYDGINYKFTDYLQYRIRGWDCDSLVLFNLDKIKLI